MSPEDRGNDGYNDAESEVASVQAAVQDAGADWQADVTSMTALSQEEKVRRLGAIPPPGEMTLQEIEALVQSGGGAPAIEASAVGAPAAYDLRNVGGSNFITPVKDQGSCGSCVAFGTCSTLEGTLRVQLNNANLAVDFSEAHLFYCYAREQGQNCGTGWWPDKALECCKTGGVVDEACYPYTPGDQNCTGRCADWANRLTKITGYHKVTSTADMKTHLSTKGPLSVCMIVYNDFFSYKSGVYKHVSGAQAGGHCICCVGYNDPGGYWICKNNWNTGWGEAGFFRIAYGECGIDTWAVYAVDGVVAQDQNTGWLNNTKITGLWAIDQDRNAWAYVQNVGWRRIAFDNDNIFFDLLTQLSTAKAGNRPVNVYQEQSIIKQVYVL